MNPPIAPLKRLTLEDMPPTASQSPRSGSRNSEAAGREGHTEGSSADPDYEDSSSSEDEEDLDKPDHVRSPTRLVYSIEALPEKMKSVVRDAFNEPPVMMMQRCRQLQDTYAFQMTETVTRSIRIRAPTSGRARLTCSCASEAQSKNDGPCPHLLWLLDQLAKQTLYDDSSHENEKPLTMTSAGYPLELGDPYKMISNHHLKILADDLHCELYDPEGQDSDQYSDHRAAESRELLSAIHQAPTDTFRPDLLDKTLHHLPTIQKNDIDGTVFRMLLENDSFFHYFLSKASRSTFVRDPFRVLSHRIKAVLHELDTSASPEPESTASELTAPEESNTVAWAARHITGVVNLVRSAIWSSKRPLQLAEKESAARVLIQILDSVSRRNRDYHTRGRRCERNLYLRLIGDFDNDFIVKELAAIQGGALSYLHIIENIIEQITTNGAPLSYVTKLRELVAHVRKRGASAGLKRQVEDNEVGESALKRMK